MAGQTLDGDDMVAIEGTDGQQAGGDDSVVDVPPPG